jgi:predicted RNase H-like HicB family nuclease
MNKHKVTVILLPTGEDSFQVFIPHFPNCITLGDTLEEALANAKEALELLLEEPTELDLEALEYSHSPIVTVGEIEIEVPTQAKVKTPV